MTFTFKTDLSSTRDKVRQLIGDVDAAHVEIQDETIAAYVISIGDSALAVAYQLALDLAAKYSRIVAVTLDHQTSHGEQIASNYRKLAESLYAQLKQAGTGSTADNSGIFATGFGDFTGPYDVPTLPQLS